VLPSPSPSRLPERSTRIAPFSKSTSFQLSVSASLIRIPVAMSNSASGL
jgi:hypothetical protein